MELIGCIAIWLQTTELLGGAALRWAVLRPRQ